MKRSNHGISRSFTIHQLGRAVQLALIPAALACLYPPASADGAVSIRTVAVTGQPAPGTPEGVNFWVFTTPLNHSIMHPVIDELGQLGFTGRLIGPGVDATNRNGLWMEQDGGLALVARSGTQAPGTPSGVLFNGFATDYIPFPPSAAGGRLAFMAELVGPGVSFGNNSGIWKQADSGLQLVARDGDQAAGFPNGVAYGAVLGLADFNEQHHLLIGGQVFGPGITAANDEVLWSDRSGSLQVIAQDGQPAPGTNGLVFGEGQLGAAYGPFPKFVMTSASELVVEANLAGPGVTAFNDEAIYLEQDGQLTLLLREGDPVPGMPGVTFGGDGVTLSVFSLAAAAGPNVAFMVDLGGQQAPINVATFSTHTGKLEPIVMFGDPAPNQPYTFGVPFNPVLNDVGYVAFQAATPDDDNDPFTQPPYAIWSDRSGSLEAVAHPGDLVPTGQDTVTFVGTTYLFGFNDAGQVAFRGYVDVGAQYPKDALFINDPQLGTELVVMTGQSFDVFGDGSEFRTVERIEHGPAYGGAGISNDGQIAFRLDFTDQSSGHYVAQLGAPPCPADVDATGVVNIYDLLAVIANWGATGINPADVTGDQVVNINDLLAVIAAWGGC
ncbi:MAG: hypothetical protein L0Y44_06340 [Phycisphaerales bacterium]|nr:hypothetical protein [Phycisphaerales bacterium]MCI0630258.1 hypothetical protein [Phycisphaerales bacterium]MCI0676693.1 hypothetical protein [Phycisphaerales bacterium]